jgi:predicted RNase H-like HicB family nuclease
MTITLSLPITIQAVVHTIEGGGYWAEVPSLPGCVAQAETLESLQANILLAIDDWLAETSEKTEDEARRLAAIQGTTKLPDESYPQPYEYRPPSSWLEEEQLTFWNALNAPTPLTESQKQLGAIMRGDA